MKKKEMFALFETSYVKLSNWKEHVKKQRAKKELHIFPDHYFI